MSIPLGKGAGGIEKGLVFVFGVRLRTDRVVLWGEQGYGFNVQWCPDFDWFQRG